jgi:hypothetical protein
MSLPILIFFFFLFSRPVSANCPVCIVTVGGGLLIAEKLGIDPLLVSIWISGLNTALAFYFASFIKRKPFNHPYLWSFLFFITTVFYLWYTEQAFLGINFWGIDKSLFGLSLGLLTFFLSRMADSYLRFTHQGHVAFPYQKVILPFIFLLIVTLWFKFLI